MNRHALVSLAKFGLVGGLTVLIDAAAYALLSWGGVDVDLAKGVSFFVGAVFAYFANWRFTFGQRRGRWSEAIFVVVYLLALVLNVAVNAMLLAVLPAGPFAAAIAFVGATGVSALWNFTGMSLFVFRRPERPAAERNHS